MARTPKRLNKTDAVLAAKRPGSGRAKPVFSNVAASKILSVLRPDWFIKFNAVSVAGDVVWCNFDLARELGFEVPSSNRMTPEFHRQLIDALSYRALRDGEDVCGRRVITMYADKYGGNGLGPSLGAGRAGFLPHGNLYLKGVGITPLFRHNDPDDFAHSHGGVQMSDALSEAVFGEVNNNLLTQGSTRILAIIDQGESVTYPSGQIVPVALVVRAGAQLRPGHLLARRIRGRGILLEAFANIARETGQLVMRNGATSGEMMLDMKATILRIIDDHARTAAEQLRWRMVHGALTTSNMEMSGAMLDLTTQSHQPRTAPIHFLKGDESVFGSEHKVRAAQIHQAYQALLKRIPAEQRQPLGIEPINFAGEMEAAYNKHLQMSLLGATGLKAEVACRVRADHSDLARRFTEIVTKMIELRNPGSVEAAKAVAEDVSVLDVFNLFRNFPEKCFEDPDGDHAAYIRAQLKPVFKGNRFHVAKKRSAVDRLIEEFGGVYRELMRACESMAREYYGDAATMQASIRSRAAFENEPVELYWKRLYEQFNEAVASYKSTGDVAILREAIDKKIALSLRNVDALLIQGESRRMSDGGFELGMRAIDGVNYSIRAWNDRKQTRLLCVSVPARRDRICFATPLAGLPRLTRRQIKSLRYRFTLNGWATFNEIGVRLKKDAQGRFVIACEEIRNLPLAGRLEGAFHLEGVATNVGVYAFAIPDKRELMKLAEENHSA